MSASDSVSSRSEIISNSLESLAAASGVQPADLIKMCDEYLVGKAALVDTLNKYVLGIFGKLIPEDDKDVALSYARTFILSLSLLRKSGTTVKIDDIVTVDPLAMGQLLQMALSSCAKITTSPTKDVASNFSEFTNKIPQIIMQAFKTTPLIWKAISAVNATPGESIRAIPRIGNETLECHRFMMIQLLQTFGNSNNRTIVEYLTGQVNQVAGTTNVNPIVDGLAVSKNLQAINKAGRFHPGTITTICGNVGSAACILKCSGSYGACCNKHLAMCLALIPTGPFCMSHGLSDSAASSIAFHPRWTLSFLHIYSIIQAARGSDGVTSEPLKIDQPPQGYVLAGDDAELSKLNAFYQQIDHDVLDASRRISEALGQIFTGDNLNIGGLSTIAISNGVPKTLKSTTKHLPEFAQQSIAGRSWYLRMLNLINKGQPTYSAANFTRENIVRQVFGSSMTLAMYLNFNTNQPVIQETLKLIGDLFTGVTVSSASSAISSIDSKFADDEAFAAGLVENSIILPTTVYEGISKLEASLTVVTIKPTTTKIPEGTNTTMIYSHSPVLYGTGFVAVPKPPKAVGDSIGNSEFFQTPVEELNSVLSYIKSVQQSKPAKPAPKARSAAKSSASTAAMFNHIAGIASIADDFSMDGANLGFIQTMPRPTTNTMSAFTPSGGAGSASLEDIGVMTPISGFTPTTGFTQASVPTGIASTTFTPATDLTELPNLQKDFSFD